MSFRGVWGDDLSTNIPRCILKERGRHGSLCPRIVGFFHEVWISNHPIVTITPHQDIAVTQAMVDRYVADAFDACSLQNLLSRCGSTKFADQNDQKVVARGFNRRKSAN